jgi:hypothetical protein
MRKLSNASQVMEALGGPERVVKLTKSTRQAVWNWYGYFEAFPPDTYVVMMRELARRGATAPPHLWKMRGYERPKRAA